MCSYELADALSDVLMPGIQAQIKKNQRWGIGRLDRGDMEELIDDQLGLNPAKELLLDQCMA